MQAFGRDLRHTVRGLLRQRAYSLLVVVTLVTGMGATVAAFSCANWLVLRPIPGVRDGKRLLAIRYSAPDGTQRSPLSVLNLRAIETTASALDGLVGAMDIGEALAVNAALAGGVPRRSTAEVVTDRYFEVLGIQMEAGRPFSLAETADASVAPTAVISDRVCRALGLAAAGAVGRELLLNGRVVTIVGVTGNGFHGTRLALSTDIWLPVSQRQIVVPSGNAEAVLTSPRHGVLFLLIGRLRPGHTVASLQSQLASAERALQASNELDARVRSRHLIAAGSADAFDRDHTSLRRAVVLLNILAGLLLALGCANAAHLMVARYIQRMDELNTRRALGASPWSLARLIVAEGAVLSTISAGCAVLIAWAALRKFGGALVPPAVTPQGLPEIDWRVALWSAGVLLVTISITSLPPATVEIRKRRTTVHARSQSDGRGSLRRLLLTLQVATAIVLVIVATLLVRSVWRVLSIDPGFDAASVLSASVDLRASRPESRSDDYLRLKERLETVPGIRRAAVAFLPPFHTSVEARADFRSRDGIEYGVALNSTTPGYFDAVGISFKAGRDFTVSEVVSPDSSGPTPVIVPGTLARQLTGVEDAVGRVVATTRGKQYLIVGVVADSRMRRLASEESVAVAFQPLGPAVRVPWVTVVASVVPGGSAAWERMREETARVDPTAAVFNEMTADEGIRREFAEDVVLARVAGACGLVSLVIGGFGVYGGLSRRVAERGRELAIRSAVGAGPVRLALLVWAEVGRVLAGGVAMAAPGALWLARTLQARLHGMSPLDGYSLAVGAAVIVATVIIASAPASYRASRADLGLLRN